MDYDTAVLTEGCEKLGIKLTEKQIGQFILYYELLTEKNKVMNLTAITEFKEVLVKHFLDSLSVAREISLKESDRVIDLGTGAGFPGIPLKIVYPETRFVLIDSLNKRILFLEEIIDKCQLKKITAVHGRAEDLAKKEMYREQFDYCVSRAVANLSSLSEYCLPFVKQGGMFISYKSINIDTEIRDAKGAIKILGGRYLKQESFLLPGTDIERSLVMIRKETQTPKKFPRKAGMPSREPLRMK